MLTEDKGTESFYMSGKFCKFFYLMSKKYAIEAHGSSPSKSADDHCSYPQDDA